MKRAIVTGAGGFVGRYLVKKLLHEGVEVIAVFRKGSTSIYNLESDEKLNIVELENENLSCLCELVDGKKIDVFYNLAWEGAAGPRRADYSIQLNNVKICLDYLIEADKIGCKKFISVGSIGEYMAELALDRNITSENFMYAFSKNYTNKLLKVMNNRVSCQIVWCTLANLFGVGDSTGNLVSYTINTLKDNNVPEFGPAMQPFDFLYIEDCAEALFLIGEKYIKSNDFFIGSGNPRPLKEFLNDIRDMVAPGVRLGIGKRQDDGTEYKYEWYSIDKLVKETGFRPKYGFREGIEKIVENLEIINKERKEYGNY